MEGNEIDTSGQEPQPRFNRAEFRGGLAAVSSTSGKWGYIGRNGRWIIPPQFEYAEEFSEGLAVVTIGGYEGYIDRSGKFAIAPQFEFAKNFNEYGVAVVDAQCKERYSCPEGLIDKEGNYLLPPEYSIDDFVEGIASIYKDGKHGYVDSTGKIIVEPQFVHAEKLLRRTGVSILLVI